MSSVGRSAYISKNDNDTGFVKGNKRSPFIVIVSSVFAALFFVLTALPAVASLTSQNTDDSNKAEALSFAVLCRDFGRNMGDPGGWKNAFRNYPLENKASRTFTLEEAFGNASNFVSYNGEGVNGDFWIAAKETTPPDWSITDPAKLEAVRTFGNCSMTHIMIGVSNGIMSASNMVSILTSYIAAKAFDSNLVCSPNPEENVSDGCFNILSIIGGAGEDGAGGGGIISILTSSIYFPLLVMAVAITGGWVAYKGLVKRQLREALFGFIWVVLSVIFGLIMLLNPMLIAKAPMVISNSVSTCIIGAFNGENCFSGEEDGDSLDFNSDEPADVCISDVGSSSINEKMSLTTNSITCSIWKAFILNPLSEGSFGTSFDELTTTKDPLKKTLTDAGLDPEAYCVSLKSDDSAKELYGKKLQLQDPKKGKKGTVCNLMAYQMFLQINAGSNADSRTSADGEIDERWYKVIDAAAADDSLWSHWAPSGTSVANKFGVSFLSFFTTILGGLIIVVTAAFALVYFISGILLMAFAPIFLLIGVHPGRGKKIMLGWLEKIVSNVLKYIASAAFLIVTIAIYGGIMSNIDNMTLTFLFVLIITMALFMYRKEFMDLFGRVSMGGEKLSSAMSDKLRDKTSSARSKTAKIAGAATAGAVGASLSSGKNPFDLRNAKSNIKTAVSGASDSAKRELRRSSGFVGNVTRQVERDNVSNRQALRQKATETERSLSAATDNLSSANNEVEDARNDYIDIEQTHRRDQEKRPEIEEQFNEGREAESHVLDDMKDFAAQEYARRKSEIDSDPTLDTDEKARQHSENDAQFAATIDFTELKELYNNMRDLSLNIKYEKAIGNEDGAKKLQAELNSKKARAEKIAEGIPADEVRSSNAYYDNELHKERISRGLGSVDSNEVDEKLLNISINETTYSQRIVEAEERIHEAENKQAKAIETHQDAKIEHDAYSKFSEELMLGTTLTGRTMDNLAAQVAREQEKTVAPDARRGVPVVPPTQPRPQPQPQSQPNRDNNDNGPDKSGNRGNGGPNNRTDRSSDGGSESVPDNKPDKPGGGGGGVPNNKPDARRGIPVAPPTQPRPQSQPNRDNNDNGPDKSGNRGDDVPDNKTDRSSDGGGPSNNERSDYKKPY